MRYTATVYFEKHVSGLTMRYGVYHSFHEAATALKHLKSVNTIDYCYIEESYTNTESEK